MDNSLIVEGLNIAELNDEELSERLQLLGFNPGPILESTRSVYQRKLARILRNEESFEAAENEMSDECDDEVRPSPILNSTLLDYSSTSSSPSSFSVDDLRRRPLPRYEGSGFHESPPVLTPHKPWNINDIVTQVEPPPGEMEKPLIPTSFKIVAFIFVLLFAFFVYYNMESTPSNPFSTLDKNA